MTAGLESTVADISIGVIDDRCMETSPAKSSEPILSWSKTLSNKTAPLTDKYSRGTFGLKLKQCNLHSKFCSPWFGFCISVQDQNWLSEVSSAVNGLQLEGGIEHRVKGLFYNLSLLWLVVAKHCLGIKGDDHIRIAQSGVV